MKLGGKIGFHKETLSGSYFGHNLFAALNKRCWHGKYGDKTHWRKLTDIFDILMSFTQRWRIV